MIKNAEFISLSNHNLKKFGDLKFKNSIIWIVELFNLIQNNVELKSKLSSYNWIMFLIR